MRFLVMLLMLMALVIPAYGMGAAPAGGIPEESPGLMGYLIAYFPFILLFALFYLLFMRPQTQKAKKEQEMRESLRNGDKVVTIGGIHGVITNLDKTTVTLRVDDRTKIVVTRSAVSYRQTETEVVK